MKKDVDGYITIPKRDDKKEIPENTSEYLKSIENISESIKNFSQPLLEMQKELLPILTENSHYISDTITNFAKTLMESIDFDSLINISISSKLTNALKILSEKLGSLNLGVLSEQDSEFFKKNYFVIPFEYNLYELDKLTCLNKNAFKKEMLKYFNNSRMKRLFNYCIKNTKRNDQKIILKQIKRNYFLNNHAICITSLITYLDSLSLELIDDSSTTQHLSHKAIDSLHDYYLEEVDWKDKGYEMFLKIRILKNFYDILYSNDENLKNAKSNVLNRNINSHGAKYINRQYETIRLINAIWFIQSILDDTNMKDFFISYKDTKDKNRVKFKPKK